MIKEEKSLIKSAIGEFLGCFFIVFFTTIFTQDFKIDDTNESVILKNSVTTFVMVSTMIWMFYNISGGHFHAGITIGSAMIGNCQWMHAFGNVVGQAFGILVADSFLYLIDLKNEDENVPL